MNMNMKKNGKFKPFDIIVTLVSILTALIICEILYKVGENEHIINVIMVLSVFIISTVTDGYFYGVSASVVSVLIFDFLYISPRFGFNFTFGIPVTLIIMLVVSLTTNTVLGNVKQKLITTREKERRAELMYDIYRKLLHSGDEYTIVRHATRYLTDTMNCSAALYTISNAEIISDYYIYQTDDDILPVESIEPDIYNVVKCKSVVISDSLYCTPVITQDNIVYGVLAISCRKKTLSEADKSLIDLLSDQTAHAMRIHRLTIRQQEIMIAAETEKVRNSFLRGISHDLRTPLTSIIGSSAAILESDLPPDKQIQLIKGIQSDSQWLLSMVENILLITRIHEHNMKIQKTDELAEEIVSEAVAIFRKRFPDISITIKSNKELIFVPMDALLITQIINNLLYNSQRHSHVQNLMILISIAKRFGYAEFIISDNGIGIHENILPHLFEVQPVKDKDIIDSSRGLGLGLSICKAITEVHGGWIKARNKPDGGAEFIFAIPLEDN